MALNNISAPNNTRNDIVDMLSTKDLNLKGRRVINASPAQDSADCVILDQLNQVGTQAASNLTSAIALIYSSFRTAWTFISFLVSKIIKVQGPIYSLNGGADFIMDGPFVRLQYDPDGHNIPGETGIIYGDLVAFNPATQTYLPLAIRASILTLGSPNGKLAFYTDDSNIAVTKQILDGYSSYVMDSFFNGITNANPNPVYAQVNDLNNLRQAYENLRVMCEDLREKIQDSTLIG